MPSPPSLPRAADAAAVALVLGALALAYANAFEASFQFDDWDVIVRDPRVQSVEAWWAAMPGIRPLLKLSYALNHASGLGSVGFHAVNVAIHAGNALLVLALARRLAARHRPDDSRAPRWIALGAAVVFALHPVQTEAVTYASGRSTSLSTAFALASLLLWTAAGGPRSGFSAGRSSGASGEAHGAAPRPSAAALLLLSSLAMLAAIATKESAVFVPALILLWAWTDPVARPAHEPAVEGVAIGPGPGGPAAPRPRARLARALRASACHWLVLLAALAAASRLPAYRSLAATSLATRSPLENLVAQLHAIAWLVVQLVRFDRLNADPALEPVTRLDAEGIAIACVLLLALGAAVRVRRRAPLAAFAVAWTLIAWLPTNSLVARLDVANDRQWYAALFGPAVAVGALLGAIATGTGQSAAGGNAGTVGRRTHGSPARPALAAALLAALALGLGFATHRRNAVYRDELVFWLDVARKAPGNARAFNNLGLALAERCELDAAAAAWAHALALDPTLVRAGANLRLLREGATWAPGCAASEASGEPAAADPGSPGADRGSARGSGSARGAPRGS